MAAADESATRDPLSNDSIPAAFWDATPENEGNPDLMAIKALQEESTPEERAESLKDQGNELFKRGVQLNKRYYLQQAIDKYSEGLGLLKAQGGSGLASTLRSNRAQTHLRLANNRSALNDALAALEISQDNAKAAFRGATAALRLGEFDKAAEVCSRGLQRNPAAPELVKLLEEIERKATASKLEREREAAQQLAARAPARELALAIKERSWSVGAPQVSIGGRKPFIDEAGAFHWPLLFMYPEVMQNDIVEDACETDTLKDHLDAMFAPDAPPLAWDPQGQYSRDVIELYYLSHAAVPLPVDKLTEALHSGWPEGFSEKEPARYGEKATRAVRIEESATLHTVLQRPDLVVPGLPVFFVLAKGTKFRDKFLESAGT